MDDDWAYPDNDDDMTTEDFARLPLSVQHDIEFKTNAAYWDEDD